MTGSKSKKGQGEKGSPSTQVSTTSQPVPKPSAVKPAATQLEQVNALISANGCLGMISEEQCLVIFEWEEHSLDNDNEAMKKVLGGQYNKHTKMALALLLKELINNTGKLQAPMTQDKLEFVVGPEVLGNVDYFNAVLAAIKKLSGVKNESFGNSKAPSEKGKGKTSAPPPESMATDKLKRVNDLLSPNGS